jgi:hypothetical protein
MTTKQSKAIVKLLESIDLDIYEADIKDIETVDELTDWLQDQNYFDVEIVYYHKAMLYLLGHDDSLRDSMAIADEYGYQPKDLNSELLASLLASQKMKEAYDELQDDLKDIL